MPEINRVAIVGAGALGAYFTSRFQDAGGFSVALIAAGERLERLEKNGLVVNGDTYRIPVLDPASVSDPFDLVIVALKHHHLAGAVHDIGELADTDTMVMSVMNGLDSEAIIGEEIGMDKLLYTVSVGIDAVRSGNSVVYSNPGVHHFGELDNTRLSDRVQRVQQAFDRAGIQHTTPVDMIRTLWWKFMINVGVNPLSAVMRAPYAAFQTMPEARQLMEASMKEVIALARAEGVNLSDQDLLDWYPVLDSLSPEGKTSMLQDVENGAKTEVEIFCQKVVDLGISHGIPTPVNEMLLKIIRVLERPSSS